jgi:hypothetical protein
MSLAPVRDVVVKSRGHDEIFDNQIAVQGPYELVWLASFRVGSPEAPKGALDDGVVLLDGF